MSLRHFLVLLILATSGSAVCAASISRDDAASRVLSAGYTRVSKTEPAPGSWDVWASRDGIPYEVKVSATDGTLVAAVPVEDND
jgi:hypothetical protein